MRKKIYYLFMILVIALITTGCVKFDTNISISRNGSAHIEDIAMMKDEAIAFADINLSEKAGEINSKNSGTKAEVIHEDGYTGLKTIRDINNIEKTDIADTENRVLGFFKENGNCGKIICTEKTFFKTKYYIKSIADYSEGDKSRLDFITGNISIKIPTKALEHNAQYVDENKHIYNWIYDTTNPKNNINLTYELLNIHNVAIVIVLFFVILLALCIWDICIRSNKKCTSKVNNINTAITDEIKQCPYCGEDININAKKCKFCGEWLNKEENTQNKKTYCPNCGEEIDNGLDICPLCGKRINNDVL